MKGDHEPLIIGPKEMDALMANSERLQSKMCMMEHPFYRVLCMKKIGHDGQHWFMARWQDAASAMKDVHTAIENAVMSGESS